MPKCLLLILVPDVLLGALCDADRILFCRRIAVDGQKSQVCMTWLNPGDGREHAHVVLDALSEKTPFVGPLLVAGGRLWTFYGRTWSDGTRDLLELVPGEQGQQQVHPGLTELTAWRAWPDERTRLLTDQVLPGWTLIAGASPAGQPARAEVLAEHAGERDVLLTRANMQSPVQLLKWIEVPEKNDAQLTLRVGHRPGTAWRLVVRVAGKEVLQEVVNETTASGGWLDKQLKLTDYSGRRVCVSVSQTAVDAKQPAEAIWKRIERVP